MSSIIFDTDDFLFWFDQKRKSPLKFEKQRIQEALKTLGRLRKYLQVSAYTCDPERCKHSESVILKVNGHIPVCYSLDELKNAVIRTHGLCKRDAISILMDR